MFAGLRVTPEAAAAVATAVAPEAGTLTWAARIGLAPLTRATGRRRTRPIVSAVAPVIASSVQSAVAVTEAIPHATAGSAVLTPFATAVLPWAAVAGAPTAPIGLIAPVIARSAIAAISPVLGHTITAASAGRLIPAEAALSAAVHSVAAAFSDAAAPAR